jgi:hypothetical protein
MHTYRVASFLILIVPGLAAAMEAQDGKQATPPSVRATASAIRMDLRPKATAVYTIGKKPDLVLRLLTPKGQPYTAPKDFNIVVEALTGDGRVVHKESITLKKGKSLEEFDLDIDRLTLIGAIRVRTTHRELLEGGTILYGMRRGSALPAIKKAAFVSWTSPVVLAHWDRASWRASPYEIVPAALAFEQGTTGCGGTFLVTPARTFWANGRDAAELTLVVEPPLRDTSFFVQTTRGHLSPNPIVIKVGQPVGSAQLTSDSVGEAQITCVRAVPAATTSETATTTVRFTKPVTGFELAVTPPRIPYIDRAQITVTLLSGEGEDRTPIATDEKRTIALTRDRPGEIIPEHVEIAPGKFQGSAVFQPYDRGIVRISASTPDFPSQQVPLNVELPLLMFLLPPLGGLCGGGLAAVRETLQRRRKAVTRHRASLTGLDGPLMRIVTGLITGALLQWAMVFEVLPILPRRVVMSLVSWFFVPVIGGWLGTEVFRLVLNHVGNRSKMSARSL